MCCSLSGHGRVGFECPLGASARKVTIELAMSVINTALVMLAQYSAGNMLCSRHGIYVIFARCLSGCVFCFLAPIALPCTTIMYSHQSMSSVYCERSCIGRTALLNLAVVSDTGKNRAWGLRGPGFHF